eukprot:CAMPEP_0198127068 /NCGR_PEP_ID=MMETSP1442-20131203/46357_1 /TAXON_ID= /ORGANISM="Craspedostauros australis, Strain CCMP3328" /LENGTH=399 /DNA_ID=CAMNT_0043786987 /DNA_START=88 /DNA_END=1287 /DNA_ORIENTATION=+
MRILNGCGWYTSSNATHVLYLTILSNLTPIPFHPTLLTSSPIKCQLSKQSLLTKEPRAASIRASSTLTKCLTFDKDDFPASCPLSGKAVHEADVDDANEKYGVALKDITTISNKQISDSVTANQTRGSVNRPGVITGVDTDDDLDIADTVLPNTPAAAAGAPSQLTQDQDDVSSMDLDLQSDAIIPLLMRFRLLRLVGRCFNYIKKNRLRVADVGGRRRRAMLVKRLLPSQHVEFTDAFTLIDADGDGSVTLKEMRKALDSIDESSISNEDLRQAFQDGDGSTNGSTNGNAVAATNGSSSTNGANGLELADDMEKETLRYADFMGIMAEADLYYLFRDTFQALDTRDSGFVRAKDLDRVLCGVRDLISDDRKSIIDVEDTEILIDYEQFSQMLLGKALS